MPVERRSIEELATLYELEPELHDVFVEGKNDKVLYEWYLNRRNAINSSVFEIDCINIPPDIVQRHNLDSGNRGRVITLAYELDERLPDEAKTRITAIADSDNDYLLNITHQCQTLLLTDYSSLEMYLYNERVIGKFLSIVIMGAKDSAQSLIDKFTPILQKLFVIRLANKSLCWNMKWLSFERTCKILNGEIQFSENEFIRRYLLKNSRIKEYSFFLTELSKFSKNLKSEIRYQINGHDFFSLLRWYLLNSVRLKDPIKSEKGCERSIFACVELNDLDNEQMFKSLLNRMSTN